MRAPPSGCRQARRNRHKHRGGRGFTLVELVMVIVILGLLSVVVLPRFSATNSVRSAAFRDEAVAALRYAHKTAISHRRLVCVAVTPNAVSLSIAASNPASACGSPLPGPDGQSAFASSGTPLITSGTGTIYFQPSGIAGPPGGSQTYNIGIQDEPAIVVVGDTGHVS